MSKILKNTTASTVFVNDTGVSIPASSSYTIPPQDYLLWAASSDIITLIGSSGIVVNDGSFDLSISDGTDLIKGLFPKIVATTVAGQVESYFNEISSVASGISAEVASYTAVAGDKIVSVELGGTNIAKFDVKLDGNVVARCYTHFGNLNGLISFSPGMEITAGQVVKIYVLHSRPSLGDFNAKILKIGV